MTQRGHMTSSELPREELDRAAGGSRSSPRLPEQRKRGRRQLNLAERQSPPPYPEAGEGGRGNKKGEEQQVR